MNITLIRDNPVVLIATHDRKYITCENIDSLLRQSVVPKIVLVVSSVEEYDYYRDRYRNVEIINRPNNPLGAKWQAGVDACRILKPDPLIITGSDDLLGKDFIKNICSINMDFVGINKWWVVHGAKAFYLQYAFDNFPLGGGRAYSGKLLDKLNYQVFDTSKELHLDDKGWNESRVSGLKCAVVDAETHCLNIISIKGSWEMMNPVQRLLTSNRIKILKNDRIETVLQNLLS